MTDIPRFKLYGEDDPDIENRIQPRLPLRGWETLTDDAKKIMLQELSNKGWINDDDKLYKTMKYLNHHYLSILPARRLHEATSVRNIPWEIPFAETAAADDDFEDIFMNHPSGDLVLCMLSMFVKKHIKDSMLHDAQEMQESEEREDLINRAFSRFDRLANCLNHIFEQFSINLLVTRGGLIPRQDDRIDREIYQPTLKVLSDPKWKSVSDDLADMFNDYQEQSYPEAITKAHSAVQRFLQILVGNEGKNGKGEVGKLFALARKDDVISENQFTREIVNVFQGFISRERANNSTAKPALQPTSSSDALLIMNVVMVFLQHCLQNTGHAGDLQ